MKAQMAVLPDNPTDVEERGDRVYFVARVTGTQLGALALPGMSPVGDNRAIRLPPEPAWVQLRDS